MSLNWQRRPFWLWPFLDGGVGVWERGSGSGGLGVGVWECSALCGLCTGGFPPRPRDDRGVSGSQADNQVSESNIAQIER